MTGTLRARGLSVHFGATVAVQPLHLDLLPGRLVAVTGPSGAGKSSLLGALAGLHPAAAGTVELDGAALRDRDDAVSRHIVLIPQGNALVRLLSAEENVALPLLDRRHRHVRDAARAALGSVGLADSAGQLVEELSGGQQQRLAIARGLAERGAVLLADEPTSERDAANRAVVMALLRAESNRGAAVLVATHDPDAAALCDAELRLDEGSASWVRDDHADRDPGFERPAKPG